MCVIQQVCLTPMRLCLCAIVIISSDTTTRKGVYYCYTLLVDSKIKLKPIT